MKVVVVIPNWNGAKDLPAAVDSVLAQSYADFTLVIVDNGSTDDSRSVIEAYQKKDDRVRSIYREKNYGYTGGVNPGLELAITEGAEFAAPLNNDAVADKDWLKHLTGFLQRNPKHGIAACAILDGEGKTIDSTADQYTIWGLAFPRGRGEPADERFDHGREIFGASGGASLYRVAMLKQTGLLDQDFFAYYEDIDLSFRAQLSGWKVGFVPEAVVHHARGKTTARLGKTTARGSTFLTTQFVKNLAFIVVKDVPLGLLPRVLPRFMLAHGLIVGGAFFSGRVGAVLKGIGLFYLKLPKKLWQRRQIQKRRQVSNQYLWSIFVHDLPPQADKLRKLLRKP
jgi:GT2 family glycosyltransferase